MNNYQALVSLYTYNGKYMFEDLTEQEQNLITRSYIKENMENIKNKITEDMLACITDLNKKGMLELERELEEKTRLIKELTTYIPGVTRKSFAKKGYQIPDDEEDRRQQDEKPF
jgi:hypothetical protein